MTLGCCAKQSIAPGVALALLPKCPVCVAAFIAVATRGATRISLTDASAIREWLALACYAALAFVAMRAAVSLARRVRS